MAFYRKEFNSNVTPKMHMVPFITKWKFGLGFMGEQGAESIHTSFNSIKRAYLGIPNKIERLLCVVQEHHLRVEPENVSSAPTLKKDAVTHSNTPNKLIKFIVQ